MDAARHQTWKTPPKLSCVRGSSEVAALADERIREVSALERRSVEMRAQMERQERMRRQALQEEQRVQDMNRRLDEEQRQVEKMKEHSFEMLLEAKRRAREARGLRDSSPPLPKSPPPPLRHRAPLPPPQSTQGWR